MSWRSPVYPSEEYAERNLKSDPAPLSRREEPGEGDRDGRGATGRGGGRLGTLLRSSLSASMVLVLLTLVSSIRVVFAGRY